MDGYDFHCVSLSISSLAKDFHVPRQDIKESITLTLLFRTVGAAVFGISGDIWGRKWAMIVNMLVIAVLQIGTAYARQFRTFLAVRALFGIGMGRSRVCETSLATHRSKVVSGDCRQQWR